MFERVFWELSHRNYWSFFVDHLKEDVLIFRSPKPYCFITPVLLTFAGLAIAAQAESRATAAGSGLVAVPQQTDVRTASSLPKLVHLTCMAAHWTPRRWKIKSQTQKHHTVFGCAWVCVCAVYLGAGVSGGRRAALLPCPPWSLLGSLCC